MISAIVTLLCVISNCFLRSEIIETVWITSATVLYHFGIRITSGEAITAIFGNGFDYNKRFYRELPFEKRFYKLIKIRKWKQKIPTYSPEQFDFQSKSISELIVATCRAEVVHWINIILSFAPILIFIRVEPAVVFWLTSILAALADFVFVILQRYNRPRLIKIQERRSMN